MLAVFTRTFNRMLVSLCTLHIVFIVNSILLGLSIFVSPEYIGASLKGNEMRRLYPNFVILFTRAQRQFPGKFVKLHPFNTSVWIIYRSAHPPDG